MTYEDQCRRAARRQMPAVPAEVLDSLPLDNGTRGGVYLAQTGGFCMALACADRLMVQDGWVEGTGYTMPMFYVGGVDEIGEETPLYEGIVFADAYAVLTAVAA